MTASHKVPNLGHLAAYIEKYGIGFTYLEKPHIGANQFGGFFYLREQGQGCLFPSR
jgi:hypothetical protein